MWKCIAKCTVNGMDVYVWCVAFDVYEIWLERGGKDLVQKQNVFKYISARQLPQREKGKKP